MKHGQGRPGPTNVLWFVLIVYFTTQIIGNSIGALLPEIKRDFDFSSSTSADITNAGTAGQFLAKFTMGPVVDFVGGKPSLYVIVFMTSSLVALQALSRSTTATLLLYTALMYCVAPNWPAAAVVFRESFPEWQYDALFRRLAISSRLGGFVALAFFGPILEVVDWQGACLVTAGVAVVGTLLATLVLYLPTLRRFHCRQGTVEEKSDVSDLIRAPLVFEAGEVSPSSSPSTPELEAGRDGYKEAEAEAFSSRLRRLLREPWLRWALFTMGMLMCITNQTFLVTTFFDDTISRFSDEYEGSSGWLSPQWLGTAFPLGLLMCVVFPAHWYERFEPGAQRRLCLALQCFSLCAAVGLIFAGGHSTEDYMIGVKVVLVFCLTFGVGIAYCFCNSIIDGVGYICSIAFQFAMSALFKTSVGWRGVWAMSAGCLVLSIFGMHRFFGAVSRKRLEMEELRGRRRRDQEARVERRSLPITSTAGHRSVGRAPLSS